jgi:hypothetical protein
MDENCFSAWTFIPLFFIPALLLHICLWNITWVDLFGIWVPLVFCFFPSHTFFFHRLDFSLHLFLKQSLFLDGQWKSFTHETILQWSETAGPLFKWLYSHECHVLNIYFCSFFRSSHCSMVNCAIPGCSCITIITKQKRNGLFSS